MKSMMIKNVLAVVSILISSIAAFGDSLYIDSFEIGVGEAKEISINLSNTQSVSAFQTEVILPVGLVLEKQNDSWMALTDRASSDHSVNVNYNGSDNAKVICFSNSNRVFSGNEGPIVTMKVRANSDFLGGFITLYGNKLSDTSNKDVILDTTSCYVMVEVPVTSITLSHESAELMIGESLYITADILPDNATDRTVSWSSDNTDVALVDDDGKVLATGIGTATITASCGNVTSQCKVTVVATPVESVTLSMSSAELYEGEMICLVATVYPENATDKSIVWSSDNTAVATVDQNGNVSAVSAGSAIISASCGNEKAECVLTVISKIIAPENLFISQESASLKVGDNLLLTATVVPENASDKTVTWKSDNEAVATVDANGNVTAVALGSATITASCGNYAASCYVSVVATEVESVTISQETAQLKVGQSIALTANVYPEEATDKTVIWSSDNESVATVDANGNVTAIALGSATITASCGNYAASCYVSVVVTEVESVTISQETAQLKVGQSIALTANVYPEDATDKTVIWSSDNESVATVDANGNVTAVALGSATITASCGSYAAPCYVSVVATEVESVVISQETAQLKVGQSIALTANVYPEDAIDKTVIWSSDNEAVATVDANGNVTAIALGSATITASCGNYSASCAVSVVATEVESVTISQETAQLKVGESFTLTANVYPEDATDKTVIWSSDNEAVATVDANGNVTAVGLGSATITASCGNYSASCFVSVEATEVESVVISQETAPLKVGQSIALTANVYPEDATDKTVIWSSDNEAVATVDADGNVTAIALGSATIIASCSGVSATCTVTVTATLVESIQLSQESWSGEEGQSLRLDATVLPEDATDKSLSWSSSDDSVATVDSDGTVSILKEGTCVITAAAIDGSGVSADCIITGLAGVDSIFSEADSFDILNLNGILICKDAGRDILKTLTPGIYIIRQGSASRKIVIR